MKNSELVKDIESNYDVKSIKYKNLNVWLEMRYRLFSKITLGEESLLKINKKTYLHILKTIFYGFFNWFRSYDSWFFSAKLSRFEIDGKYYDRFFDYPAKHFKKSLFIELSTDSFYKRTKIESKYIVSRSILILGEKIIGLFIRTSKVDLTVIEKINKKYKVDFKAEYAIKKMVSQYLIMKFLLFFNKPKIVFFAPSYGYYGYIKAFKEKNIKVVEIQHGVVLKEHFGYFFYENFPDTYFADYFLSFGENEKYIFKESAINQLVYPIGIFFLDHFIENPLINLSLKNLIQKYDKSFAISLQELELTDRLIPIIEKLAKENPTYIFVFKTRRQPKEFYINRFKHQTNMIFIDDVNIYELISLLDFHITVYSTCALEAPSLGRVNILYNIENLARIIYSDILKNPKTTIYIDNYTELNDLVKTIIPPPKLEVIKWHDGIIKSSYKKNIKKFISEIL